jgi:hypothetical protein
MRFSYHPGPILGGVLIYSENEYSFRFEVGSVDDLAARTRDTGQASVSIGSLQIEVAAGSGEVLFVWGLHPQSLWIDGKVAAPATKPGIVCLDADVVPGTSIALALVGQWITVFDRTTGWARVAEEQDLRDDVVVEVATGVLLGERRGELSSIWLHPFIE